MGLFELGAAATPPKKEVIIAHKIVKGESNIHKKEVKSPPGKLTWIKSTHQNSKI